jgi:hypothetical protein
MTWILKSLPLHKVNSCKTDSTSTMVTEKEKPRPLWVWPSVLWEPDKRLRLSNLIRAMTVKTNIIQSGKFLGNFQIWSSILLEWKESWEKTLFVLKMNFRMSMKQGKG